MSEMIIEMNENCVNKSPMLKMGKNVVSITPPIDEDYWVFRIKLYKDQSIVAFPKFFTIGIGFAKEENWNTNLPFQSGAEKIYNHIKENKKYKEITKKQCIEAIKMLQEECKKIIPEEEE